MNYHYISLLLIVSPALAMEQGFSHSQHAQLSIPSLKEIALAAYAKHLHKNAPKDALSRAQMVAWGNYMGLGNFFDLKLSDSLTVTALKRLLAQPNRYATPNCVAKTGPTRSLRSIIFSPDGRYQLFLDGDNKRYVFYTDEQLCINRMVLVDEDRALDVTSRKPMFSEDGRWLFGWHRDSIKKQVLVRCDGDSSDVRVVSVCPEEVDYTFLNADTIFLRTKRELLAAQLDDLFAQGKEALQKIYERTDEKEFYMPWNRYKTIHVVAGPRIVCVGPAEKNFEIFECGADGKYFLTKNVPVSSSSMTKDIIVHSERGMLVRVIDGYHDTSMELYQLFGDDAGRKSKMPVEKFTQCAFSPCGNYFACELGEGVELIDCTRLTSPKNVTFSRPYGSYSWSLKAWTELGLFVIQYNDTYLIQFNYAAPLVAAYAAYREKEEKVIGKSV